MATKECGNCIYFKSEGGETAQPIQNITRNVFFDMEGNNKPLTTLGMDLAITMMSGYGHRSCSEDDGDEACFRGSLCIRPHKYEKKPKA